MDYPFVFPVIFGGLAIYTGYTIYYRTTNYIETINYKTIALVAGLPVAYYLYSVNAKEPEQDL